MRTGMRLLWICLQILTRNYSRQKLPGGICELNGAKMRIASELCCVLVELLPWNNHLPLNGIKAAEQTAAFTINITYAFLSLPVL